MNNQIQEPAESPRGSFSTGDDSQRLRTFEEEMDRLFADRDRRRDSPDPWSFAYRLDVLPGGDNRASSDPIGQYVYQEHNSFFRTRMPKATHWSVVWSDLMMTMFIFFVVLFVFFSLHPRTLSSTTIGNDLSAGIGTGKIGSGGGGGPGNAGKPAEAVVDKIFSVSQQAIVNDNLEDFASVDLAPDKTVRIVLTGDLLFDPGTAELKGPARKSLARIADLLSSTPYMINVVGHTDDAPIHTARFPSNWELSTARAGAVARFLIEETGLPANRFYVTGRSSNRPILRNNSPANRAANRRVELIITRDLPEAMQVAEPEKLILPPDSPAGPWRSAGQG